MPASLILAAFEISSTSLAGGLITLAAHLMTTIAISYLINKNMDPSTPQSGQSGGSQNLDPATNNKLPVSYGDTWLAPVITDAKISTDQQTMWFVAAFCEKTSGDYSFEEIYWDDKLLLFDPANPHYIRGWLVPADTANGQPTTVTGVGGKIGMWFYKDGGSVGANHICIDGAGNRTVATTTDPAYKILQDSQIDPANWWHEDYTMKNTVFAVIKVVYDQAHQVQNLRQIKALVKNNLKAPGDVMYDYLTNDRYGCGVAPALVDRTSLNTLNGFSADKIELTNVDNTKTNAFTRYEINGFIDTTKDCLTNLVDLAAAADSWVQWNEAQGKWGVIINRSYSEAGLTQNDLFSITADNIIGGVQISPLDLNSTYNKFKVQFSNNDFTYRGQTDQRYYELPAGSLNPNEPNNELQVTLPYTSDSRQATYIAYKRLFASREDLIINFTMDYTGIQIDAGDIIKITHDWYNWNNKLFRVTQIKEMKSQDGFLSVQITATSYNDQVYSDALGNPLHAFQQSSFSSLGDPNIICDGFDSNGHPIPIPAPTFTQVNTTVSTYVVEGLVPINGRVSAMEFWYSVKGPELINNQYVLFSTQFNSNGGLYKAYDNTGSRFKEQVQTSYLPKGTYYWRTRALGPENSASDYSPPSAGLDWTPTGSPISGTNILDNSISGSKVISGDPATTTPPSQNNGFFDTLGPIALAGLGGAVAWWGYKKGIFDDILPKDWQGGGGGNDGGNEENTVTPKVWRFDPNYADNPGQSQQGDQVTMVADATPDQPAPIVTASAEGMSDFGDNSWSPNETNYGEA